MKNTKRYFTTLFIVLLSIFLFTTSQPVLANSFENGLEGTASKAGYEKSKIFPKNDIGTTISVIVKAMLSVVGVLFLTLMIYGGFIWMNAKGNEAETKKAQEIIRNTIIGIVIVLAAYTITTIINNLWLQTSNTQTKTSIEDGGHGR